MTPAAQSSARAIPLRRPDLIECDAMAAALRALGTERLRDMLGWTEEHPRNRERWDSLTVAGVRMLVDPGLLRAELTRRSSSKREAAGLASQ